MSGVKIAFMGAFVDGFAWFWGWKWKKWEMYRI